MANAPKVTDSKPDIQAALTEAGIDFAKTWNREQLVDAWNVANPAPAAKASDNGTDDGNVHMSFGPTGTEFMGQAGYDTDEVSAAGRGKYVLTPKQAEKVIGLLEVALEDEDQKAIHSNLDRMRNRIVVRLSALDES